MAHVVWFKRDLRITDHQAFSEAARRGPTVPLYILEPELWQQPDLSHRHYCFLNESLAELNAQLIEHYGTPLVVRCGKASDILQALHDEHSIEALWSHQETWNDWTYRRDQSVQRWARQQNIPWHQPRQFAVVRGRHNRDGWSRQWQALMGQVCLDAPQALQSVATASESMPAASDLNLHPRRLQATQPGGRSHALALLKSFLHTRGEYYSTEMSSPVTAFDSCSRLSAHIAFGTLSLREIVAACQQRNLAVKAQARGQKGKWPAALRSFNSRLHWHCHFIQKIEDAPRIEFENFHTAYDSLREKTPDSDRFEAWQNGRTGYPMIDACMRALSATGWINFRMRAMLMSFASYHLWLDWKAPALHLARLFTDYEPGIHYSQCQMQSGTTGINTIRAYNPIKQSMDHDPEGQFIRKWIPELADYSAQSIHQPWVLPHKLNGYPLPIVDEKLARKQAMQRIYALRRGDGFFNEAQAIVKQHGSRKTVRGHSKAPKPASAQTELDFND
jgi:deoxyribodipyrimidine photo-lyase